MLCNGSLNAHLNVNNLACDTYFKTVVLLKYTFWIYLQLLCEVVGLCVVCWMPVFAYVVCIVDQYLVLNKFLWIVVWDSKFWSCGKWCTNLVPVQVISGSVNFYYRLSRCDRIRWISFGNLFVSSEWSYVVIFNAFFRNVYLRSAQISLCALWYSSYALFCGPIVFKNFFSMWFERLSRVCVRVCHPAQPAATFQQ